MFLGGSSRLVKILRVCGVGQNISFHLTFIQRIKQRFLGCFLKLMRDFSESSGNGLGDSVEDEEESGIPGPITRGFLCGA